MGSNMTNERHDMPIEDALARLRETASVPQADPGRERALLEAFDAHHARPRPRRATWVWTAAAASLALAIGLGRLGVSDAPQVETPDVSVDLAGFVPWPGAFALPPLESGELRRVDLPRAALPALGLTAPASAAAVVPADVVIGQDGLARAVRLVRQQ
jgi:hypothetical protein